MPERDKLEIIDKVLPGLLENYSRCALCRHLCRVDRQKGEKGFCAAGSETVVYSYQAHHGEEPPLSGYRGSGTIFFTHCNLSCVYCQNWRFSQTGQGRKASADELAEMMLELEQAGCHNINLVSPTHFVPGIVEALKIAITRGLELPIVYNTGGYDSPDIIRALDGIIDIYLPDMRYSSNVQALRYSGAKRYVETNRVIVREMRRQVGVLELDPEGIALKGLIIRLLVLPGGASGTEETLEFIRKEIGPETYLSVMSQYYPAYRAVQHEGLNRRISRGEYESVLEKMKELGLSSGWIQPYGGGFDPSFAGENFTPRP